MGSFTTCKDAPVVLDVGVVLVGFHRVHDRLGPACRRHRRLVLVRHGEVTEDEQPLPLDVLVLRMPRHGPDHHFDATVLGDQILVPIGARQRTCCSKKETRREYVQTSLVKYS